MMQMRTHTCNELRASDAGKSVKIVHDMPREEAMKYVDELAIFFHSGWSGLLRLE